jgi:hypothetical protein
MVRDNYLCSCGRIAECEGVNGELQCWELFDLRRHPTDTKIVWKYNYKGQEPRHGDDE